MLVVQYQWKWFCEKKKEKISSEHKANILCLDLTTREITERLNRQKGSGIVFLVIYIRRHRFRTSMDLKNDLCRATRKRLDLYWTQDIWNNVIFSDESKFNFHVGDGKILSRWEPKERLSFYCILRMSPKTEGVIVWECFSGDEKGRMSFLESKVNAMLLPVIPPKL